LFERAASLESYWEDAVHSLRGLPHVIDLRNIGVVAGIELESRSGQIGARAFDVFTQCFTEGLLIRVTGDIIALSPPLIIEQPQIDEMFETLGRVLKKVA
jgi:beta-alanine--pyruvate transaminase